MSYNWLSFSFSRSVITIQRGVPFLKGTSYDFIPFEHISCYSRHDRLSGSFSFKLETIIRSESKVKDNWTEQELLEINFSKDNVT